MTDRPQTDDLDRDPMELDAECLAAWTVPEPAPDLAQRVLDHVDTVMTMMPDAPTTTPMTLDPPARTGLGLAVASVAMVAAAALVLGLGSWWRASSTAEPSPAVAVAGPTDGVAVPPGAPLVVRTSPRDARVWIDGKPVVGPSPFAVSRLPAGPHRLRVERDGYLPVERTLEGGAAAEIPIELSLREVVLVLSVDPPDATVQLWADGETTAIGSDGDRHVLQREAGVRYEVRAVAPGYRSRRVPLSLGSQPDVPVTLSLVPDPEHPRPAAGGARPGGSGRASAGLRSGRSPDLKDPFAKRASSPEPEPPSVDEILGGSDPDADTSGVLDPYAGVASKADERDKKKKAKKAKTATLRVGLRAGGAPARIHVDGKYVGTTPVLNIKLVPGVHRVTATWADGTTERQRVTVEDGETTTLEFG